MSPATGRKRGREAQWGSLNGNKVSDCRVAGTGDVGTGPDGAASKDRYQLSDAHGPDLATLYRQRGRLLPKVWLRCEPGFWSSSGRDRDDCQWRGGDDRLHT